MKRLIKSLFIIMSAAVLLLSCVPYASAYSPPTDTVRVGLYYNSNTLESANLENAVGSGYRFGYFDGRSFVPLGPTTSKTQISVLRDINMYYYSYSNAYYAGAGSETTVGCFHIQITTPFSSYSDAATKAATYNGSFVKYDSGYYYACVGNYTSLDNASEDAESRGIANYEITSGSSYTVTVVETGTNNILFEFDYGTSYYLGIMPISSGGEKCLTWFKGYEYYGGFEYARRSGGDMTIVNVVNIEDYIKGVIPYEMSNAWPLEALKAQALCARTYVMSSLNGHSSNNFDVCNTTCCQVYHGANSANSTTDSAVEQTAGKYITHNGYLCQTYYSSSDGGATESSENVWSAELPYLRGVIDPYEEDIADSVYLYYWTETYTGSELTDILQSSNYSCSDIVSFRVSQYTDVGNVYSITLTDSNGRNFTFSKDRARTFFGFRSMRYTINGGGSSGGSDIYVNDGSTISSDGPLYGIGSGGDISEINTGTLYAITGTGDIEQVGGLYSGSASDTYVVSGSGYGHNVGMSQWGAYSMAKYHDKTYDEIIKFYYTGVTIG